MRMRIQIRFQNQGLDDQKLKNLQLKKYKFFDQNLQFTYLA
jgi:hypothetical protein